MWSAVKCSVPVSEAHRAGSGQGFPLSVGSGWPGGRDLFPCVQSLVSALGTVAGKREQSCWRLATVPPFQRSKQPAVVHELQIGHLWFGYAAFSRWEQGQQCGGAGGTCSVQLRATLGLGQAEEEPGEPGHWPWFAQSQPGYMSFFFPKTGTSSPACCQHPSVLLAPLRAVGNHLSRARPAAQNLCLHECKHNILLGKKCIFL